MGLPRISKNVGLLLVTVITATTSLVQVLLSIYVSSPVLETALVAFATTVSDAFVVFIIDEEQPAQ